MINERLKNLNEKHINQSWQPTADDYRAIAPQEDELNYKFNYSRMVDGEVTLILKLDEAGADKIETILRSI